MGVALVSGSDQALVYDSLKKFKCEKSSKKILGRLETFMLLGILVSAPIGGLIAATLGLRYTMMLMVIPSIAAIIIALSLKEPKTQKKTESTRYIGALADGVGDTVSGTRRCF